MRCSQIPFGAIAGLGSAVATYSFDSIADLMGTSLASPTHSKCHAVPSSFEDVSTAGPANPKSSILSCLSLLPRFLSLACHTDASGYNSLDASSTSPSLRFPGPHGVDPEADSDTIAGVFHRLAPQRGKLLLVQVVFRHGARTPLSTRSELWLHQQWDVCGQLYQAAAVRLFSTSGVENPVSKHDLRQRSVMLSDSCRKGELTLLGQAQALELGQWLRSRYVAEEGRDEAEGQVGRKAGQGFLPAKYQEGLIEARTTNVSRTIATLRGVLTGIYPDLPRPPPQLQPLSNGVGGVQEESPPQVLRIPRVTTSGDLDEILYADTRACPHLGSLQAMARETGRAAVRSDPEYDWARGELLRLLNMDPTAFDSDRWIFTDVHDTLTSLAAHGKPLPPGFEQLPRLTAAINRLATKEFSAEVAPSVRDSHGRNVLTLSMGRLLHILVENMARARVEGTAVGPRSAAGDDSAACPSQPRMYLYSGHDSTIMPLLSALGHEVTEWPPYLSNLVLELWQLQPRSPSVEPRYVVRVLYNQQELPLPHCPPGFLPSLQTFRREVVGPFLLSAQRHQELCHVRVDHEGAMPLPQAKPASVTAAAA